MVLMNVAPNVDVDDVDDDSPLREQLGVDSVDWIRFLIGIRDALTVHVPEFDYALLRTLTDVVDHVELYSNNATNGLPRCRGSVTPQANRLRVGRRRHLASDVAKGGFAGDGNQQLG